jgi:hypothetical protein
MFADKHIADMSGCTGDDNHISTSFRSYCNSVKMGCQRKIVNIPQRCKLHQMADCVILLTSRIYYGAGVGFEPATSGLYTPPPICSPIRRGITAGAPDFRGSRRLVCGLYLSCFGIE